MTRIPIVVVNFSHPLTPQQLTDIEAAAGEHLRVIEVPTHFDQTAPFAPQAEALVRGIDLSIEAWQDPSLLLVLPAFAPIAASVLALVHGIAGGFPRVVRLRPADDPDSGFVFGELISLRRLREMGRRARLEIPG